MGTSSASYRGHGFPPEIISPAVWLCQRFCLSFRHVEGLLAEPGITVSYEKRGSEEGVLSFNIRLLDVQIQDLTPGVRADPEAARQDARHTSND